MKKTVKAQITWISYSDGGRKHPPLAGTRYCPIVKFKNMKGKNGKYWSTDFVCSEVNKNHSTIVNFTFLSEYTPINNLVKGNQFRLFESNKKVAVEIIVE